MSLLERGNVDVVLLLVKQLRMNCRREKKRSEMFPSSEEQLLQGAECDVS